MSLMSLYYTVLLQFASDVNKDSGHKAKAKAKDSGHKAKAKDKDLGGKAKAKAKDLLTCPWPRPRTLRKWQGQGQGQGLGIRKLCDKKFKTFFSKKMHACFCTIVWAWLLSFPEFFSNFSVVIILFYFPFSFIFIFYIFLVLQ